MNSLPWFQTFAPESSAILLEAAARSAVLLIVAAVAMHGLRRCSASTRHLILVLIVASLLVIPFLSWTLPRLAVLPAGLGLRAFGSTEADDAKLAPSAAPTHVTRASSDRRKTGSSDMPSSAPTEPSVARDLAMERARSGAYRWTLWQWVPLVWVGGVFFALAPVAGGLISLGRLARTSRVEEKGPLLESLRELSTQLGVRRPVRLLTAESRGMPMTWGFLQPKVLLPSQAIEWPEERQRVVLLHELAHIQRCDFATTLFTRFISALYWFNPLVWLAARRLRLEQEQACDDAVLGAGTAPVGYAEEVLRIAAGRTPGRLEVLGALAMARASTLEKRLRAILDGTRNRTAPTRRVVVTTLLFTTIAVIPMSILGGAAQNAAPGSTTVLVAVAAPPKTTATPELSRGLVGWWRADGNAEDSAGKHDGEFPFGISYLPGMIGQAFDFRRSYAIKELLARVSVPDSPDFQLSEAMTLDVRIHPVRHGGIILIRGDDRAGFDTWQLDVIKPGKISFNFDNAENKSAEILAPIQLNKWQHVVATFDRGAMKLYIDGVLAAESQTDLRPNPMLNSQHDPALGIGNTGGKYYSIPFDGLIDEVRIYNRALSEAEIAQSLKR